MSFSIWAMSAAVEVKWRSARSLAMKNISTRFP
jgi:hypothetical protein